jgi:purine-nucleoside phosphorylase
VGGTCGAYSKRLAVRQLCLSQLVVNQINMAENRYADAVL